MQCACMKCAYIQKIEADDEMEYVKTGKTFVNVSYSRNIFRFGEMFCKRGGGGM